MQSAALDDSTSKQVMWFLLACTMPLAMEFHTMHSWVATGAAVLGKAR